MFKEIPQYIQNAIPALPPQESNIRRIANSVFQNPLTSLYKIKEAMNDDLRLKEIAIQQTRLYSVIWGWDTMWVKDVFMAWGPPDPNHPERGNTYEKVHTATILNLVIRQLYNGYCEFTELCIAEPVLTGEMEAWRDLIEFVKHISSAGDDEVDGMLLAGGGDDGFSQYNYSELDGQDELEQSTLDDQSMYAGGAAGGGAGAGGGEVNHMATTSSTTLRNTNGSGRRQPSGNLLSGSTAGTTAPGMSSSGLLQKLRRDAFRYFVVKLFGTSTRPSGTTDYNSLAGAAPPASSPLALRQGDHDGRAPVMSPTSAAAVPPAAAGPPKRRNQSFVREDEIRIPSTAQVPASVSEDLYAGSTGPIHDGVVVAATPKGQQRPRRFSPRELRQGTTTSREQGGTGESTSPSRSRDHESFLAANLFEEADEDEMSDLVLQNPDLPKLGNNDRPLRFDDSFTPSAAAAGRNSGLHLQSESPHLSSSELPPPALAQDALEDAAAAAGGFFQKLNPVNFLPLVGAKLAGLFLPSPLLLQENQQADLMLTQQQQDDAVYQRAMDNLLMASSLFGLVTTLMVTGIFVLLFLMCIDKCCGVLRLCRRRKKLQNAEDIAKRTRSFYFDYISGHLPEEMFVDLHHGSLHNFHHDTAGAGAPDGCTGKNEESAGSSCHQHVDNYENEKARRAAGTTTSNNENLRRGSVAKEELRGSTSLAAARRASTSSSVKKTSVATCSNSNLCLLLRNAFRGGRRRTSSRHFSHSPARNSEAGSSSEVASSSASSIKRSERLRHRVKKTRHSPDIKNVSPAQGVDKDSNSGVLVQPLRKQPSYVYDDRWKYSTSSKLVGDQEHGGAATRSSYSPEHYEALRVDVPVGGLAVLDYTVPVHERGHFQQERVTKDKAPESSSLDDFFISSCEPHN
ncbi:unnamed protein product [Amoebophrya sp. A120]|nr:unnamed protein product [Amoebophrya sp. A120]|eukprot:GSA120T00007193001.1